MENSLIYILKGAQVSLLLYIGTIILSLPLGLLMSLGLNSKYKFLKKIIETYTWLFRGTPLLLQLFFIYYGLPIIGIRFSQFNSALITFVANYSAYICEIFRGSFLGIDDGQYAACKVLGITYWQSMYRIIIPQCLRIALPALSNEAIALIKDTSLVSVIGMGDILRNSKEIVTRDFSISPFIIAGIIYLIISTIIIYVMKKIEKKVSI